MIGAEELAGLLNMSAAIDAIETCFKGTLPDAPMRHHHQPEGQDLLLMPAWSETWLGVKLVTVTSDNPTRSLPLIHGVYVLFDRATGRPVELFDGSAITALRTAAVSGVATRYLSHTDARHLVLFGAGTQAQSHLEAIRTVRPIEEVTVVSRGAERARALVQRASALGLKAKIDEPDAVADADIVCTCTTSSEALFDGSLLKPGAYVNAVGAFRPEARELDDATIAGARIVVETREAALAEAGDLLIPMAAGVLNADSIEELHDVVAAPFTEPERVTVFKSVGVAFEDLAIAVAAHLAKVADATV